MRRQVSRRVLAVAACAAVALAVARGAYAASSGGYIAAAQDCPPDAAANHAGEPGAGQPDAAVPGCHNQKINVEDGEGNRYAQFGVDQIPNGASPNLASTSWRAIPGPFEWDHRWVRWP